MTKDDDEHGTSWKKTHWKTPEKMHECSTGKRAEDANIGELETARRRQGRLQSLGDVAQSK